MHIIIATMKQHPTQHVFYYRTKENAEKAWEAAAKTEASAVALSAPTQFGVFTLRDDHGHIGMFSHGDVVLTMLDVSANMRATMERMLLHDKARIGAEAEAMKDPVIADYQKRTQARANLMGMPGAGSATGGFRV